jgi:hypothetical protein
VDAIGSIRMAIEDSPFRGVEGGAPFLGAMEVSEHRLGLEEVRDSGAVGPRGEEDHLFADVVAALETVDQGTNNGLVGHWVHRGGVTGGSEEVSIRRGLGRGDNAMLGAEASDVPLHGVRDSTGGVRLDGLAKVRGGGVIVGEGTKAGFKHADQVSIDFRRIVDDVAIVYMDTYEALARRVCGVNFEVDTGLEGVRGETSQ